MSLQKDIILMTRHIEALHDFKLSKPELQTPYNNMGATITDAILQAGTKWATVVKPRLKTLLALEDARTTDGFLEMLIRDGSRNVLNWEHTEKPKRILQLAILLSNEGIQRELELKAWLQNDYNIEKLIRISGIGNKTIDYLRILSGISAVAVDRHLFRFLQNAGIKIGTNEYERAREIVSETAVQMNIDQSIIDHSIWAYMSQKTKSEHGCEKTIMPKKPMKLETNESDIKIDPYNIHEIVLCSADGGPSSQRIRAEQAQYFFPGAKWVGAVRNATDRLQCEFVILTTAHGLVNPAQVITPYDMHMNDYPVEVEAKWRTTIPALMGAGRYKLMVFYAGGCPRDEMLRVMMPILSEQEIDLLTFGRPNMYDVGKIDEIVQLLSSGTSISEIKSVLNVPDRLKFYQCK